MTNYCRIQTGTPDWTSRDMTFVSGSLGLKALFRVSVGCLATDVDSFLNSVMVRPFNLKVWMSMLVLCGEGKIFCQHI